MRLLLLIPNLLLFGISCYNFMNDFTDQSNPNYLTFKILHLLVMALCVTFIVLIITSLFAVRLVEAGEQIAQEDKADYEELHLQRS